MIEKLKKTVAAEKIVSTGGAQAQADLAEVYMFIGNSLDQADPDADYAIALCMKSAEQGYGLAMRDVGRAYQFGNGVEDDMSLAIE